MINEKDMSLQAKKGLFKNWGRHDFLKRDFYIFRKGLIFKERLTKEILVDYKNNILTIIILKVLVNFFYIFASKSRIRIKEDLEYNKLLNIKERKKNTSY